MADTIESLQKKIEIYELIVGSVEDLEWFGSQYGPGNGPHGSGRGASYASCPYCDQLKEPNNSFISSAAGHLHTCKLARLLGSPTNPPIKGTQESFI